MTDMTSEQENDLLKQFGIVIEKDWKLTQMYQATMVLGWVHATASAPTKKEAVYNLKKHIISEVPWLTSDLTVEQSFEQYMMYKKLGV